MTPLEIEILFWFNIRACDYREGDFSAPAVREAIDRFRDELGLLEAIQPETRNRGDNRTYRCTDRALAYLDYIQRVPLPVCRWEIPGPTAIPQVTG